MLEPASPNSLFDLRLDRISKRYLIRQDHRPDALASGWKEKVRRWMQGPAEFWAVRNVSFTVAPGEALGIIGPNGAGKSTVLKLLAGITGPTEGEILIRGKISALLEVGSGFHPELTGLENVYLSGSILGMTRREMNEKLEKIIDFADVRAFVDVPVKRYSSGMIVRLGFSIAAHLEPDILLLDEVLAVGDMAFQRKCLDRVLELKRLSTVVFISHDLNAVRRLCDRVIVMDRGQIAFDGDRDEAIDTYNRLTSFRSSPSGRLAQTIRREAEIVSMEFRDARGGRALVVNTGNPLCIRLEYVAHTSISEVDFSVFFQSVEGILCCQFSTWLSGAHLNLEPGSGIIEFTCAELSLQPGTYLIDATIERHGINLDWQQRCATMQVNKGKEVRGFFYHPHEWRTAASDDGGAENRFPESRAKEILLS